MTCEERKSSVQEALHLRLREKKKIVVSKSVFLECLLACLAFGVKIHSSNPPSSPAIRSPHHNQGCLPSPYPGARLVLDAQHTIVISRIPCFPFL